MLAYVLSIPYAVNDWEFTGEGTFIDTTDRPIFPSSFWAKTCSVPGGVENPWLEILSILSWECSITRSINIGFWSFV
jgi:hypothetical protein